jgi:hypothetical protein
MVLNVCFGMYLKIFYLLLFYIIKIKISIIIFQLIIS